MRYKRLRCYFGLHRWVPSVRRSFPRFAAVDCADCDAEGWVPR